jgi:queuine tRNA-ribosyltransferase
MGHCFVDTLYTKAYLRHLAIAGEMMAAQIASLHNIAFYLWLVGEARKQILQGTFPEWKAVMVEKLSRRL